jgi:hypothetical protein
MKSNRTMWAALALCTALAMTGCASTDAESTPRPVAASQPPAAPAPGGVSVTIPSTAARPTDPPLPSDYDQDTNNGLTAEEASLNQLWGITNSEVGLDAAPSVLRSTGGLTDFAAAITTRCYPIRTSAEVAELEQLRAAYTSLLGTEAAFEPAQAYFARATELCM